MAKKELRIELLVISSIVFEGDHIEKGSTIEATHTDAAILIGQKQCFPLKLIDPKDSSKTVTNPAVKDWVKAQEVREKRKAQEERDANPPGANTQD